MTTTRTAYDAIVIGVGGVGSAALYHLARRGLRVLGIEQFDVAHDRGSSHGHTRVIRQAYFEHPDYVPLLLESYRLWRELEIQTGTSLFQQIGLLEVGPPEGPVISGVLAAARQHQLEVELVERRDLTKRFPALSIPPDCQAVFEPGAGYLRVEDCVRAHVEAAVHHNAHLVTQETVSGWSTRRHTVLVQTNRSQYEADRLVICAGAWSHQLVRFRGVPLTVQAKHLHWFPAEHVRFTPESCPVFLYELPGGVFYGFPKLDPLGIKLAEHSGGEVLEDASHVDRQVDPVDLERVVGFARQIIPGVPWASGHHTVCLYTMSPDGHFIVDLERTAPTVAFVAGLSGHGFKFSPVLGQAMADLAIDHRTNLPIGFLSLDRFGVG